MKNLVSNALLPHHPRFIGLYQWGSRKFRVLPDLINSARADPSVLTIRLNNGLVYMRKAFICRKINHTCHPIYPLPHYFFLIIFLSVLACMLTITFNVTIQYVFSSLCSKTTGRYNLLSFTLSISHSNRVYKLQTTTADKDTIK